MRALLIVLNPLGVGHTADHCNGPGNNTLGQLFRETPGLELPNLFSLGLGEILNGRVFDPPARKCAASYGRMIQRSAGSDTLSGLWELAGVVSECPFTAAQQLSADSLAALAQESGVEFLLNPAIAGEEPPELRAEHLRTGNPILTLCDDSALALTAHVSVVSAARLAQLCRIVRRHADRWRITRVTGQSMTGEPAGVWRPEGEALCYSIVPPRTILNAISERGLAVEMVSNVPTPFARSGITRTHLTRSPGESLNLVNQLWDAPQNGVIFAHLSPLSEGGCPALAPMLLAFDAWLGSFLEKLENDNLLLITGCNGSAPGTLSPDHPRQELPILAAYGGRTAPLGLRDTLADVAATLGAFFGIEERGATWCEESPLITFHRPRGLNGPWGS